MKMAMKENILMYKGLPWAIASTLEFLAPSTMFFDFKCRSFKGCRTKENEMPGAGLKLLSTSFFILSAMTVGFAVGFSSAYTVKLFDNQSLAISALKPGLFNDGSDTRLLK